MCVLPSGLLRIVCATNKPPGRPCRAVQSITLICSGGRRRKGKAGGREEGRREGWWVDGGEREGEGGGGAALRSSVYKPDRWSGALTRTIKQKTTGCFLLCFFSFLLKRNPAAAARQRRQQQLRGSLSRARQSEKVATKSRGRADK